MPPFLRRLAVVFGTALILLFFSEFYFVNEGPALVVIAGVAASPVQTLLTLLELALYYALIAYGFLIAWAHFDVSDAHGLFLAGVLCGWATEAVVVPVAYEAVPFSLIFPSVSWHALVDVMLGWYAVRVVMRLDKVWASAAMFIALGGVWAAWSTWYWVEPDTLAPMTPDTYLAFALVTGIMWLSGMLLLDRAQTQPFAPSPWEVRVVLTIMALLFIGMAVPFLPFSLALVVLIGFTLLAMRRGSRTKRTRLYPLHSNRPRWWNYPLALLTPLTAALVYPAFYNSGTGIPTEDITFLLLLLGTLMLCGALVLPFTKRSEKPASVSS